MYRERKTFAPVRNTNIVRPPPKYIVSNIVVSAQHYTNIIRIYKQSMEYLAIKPDHCTFATNITYDTCPCLLPVDQIFTEDK